MKNKCRFLFISLPLILCTVYYGTVKAQEPLISTELDPVWYYIQVQGEDAERADRVFTADGTQVLGRGITTATSPSEVNKQLWRFEQSGDNYIIYNRATGKKLDIAYNSAKGISVGVLSDDPVTQWQWMKSGDYYNIKATVAPTGGDASKIYAHQANDYDSRNFVIMFENSGYNGNANSRFQFVIYDDFSIELSTDNNPVWYFITSAKPEYTNKGISDVVSSGLPDIKFSLENITKNNDRQLWKAVKKSSDAGDKRVHFINKATGNLIQTLSVYNNYYYFTQYTNQLEQSDGWLMRYLGGKQFEIFGTENDGVTRYLNASSKSQQRPDALVDENTKDTGFAWILKKTDEVSSVNRMDPGHLCIYSHENRIIVEGSDDYIIRNLQGIQINRNVFLPAGIYLVTVSNKTSKIIVK
jgi:hypothetical protein